MKIRKRKGSSDERLILTALITNKTVLARLSPNWTGDLFRSGWSNEVAGWCIDYYDKYEKAPRENIETIFEKWADKHGDEATIKSIGGYLSSLSNDYSGEDNADYVLDRAGDYFNRVKLSKHAEEIQDEVAAGRTEKAQTLADNFHKIEMGVGAGVNVLEDHSEI